ncbi:response regulator [Belliella marina]|uniref:Response regulator n=1 Tax=Belliella marina TaxID=1644146 RepID=A0ABW4VIN5_9BACT
MGKRSVLIIDDEVGILNMLSRYLKRKGFEVYTAVNLTDGKGQLQKITPDFLFLDINLPDGNGLDSLPKIKDRQPMLNIIMMSAFDYERIRFEAKSKGALAFLSKPFSLDQVDKLTK